ncbi:MAG: hypothetical protein V6Z81_09505 [Parvularculales bacterium]
MAEITSEEQNSITDLHNVGFESGLLFLRWSDAGNDLPVSSRYLLPKKTSSEPPPRAAGPWLTSEHFHYFCRWPLFPVFRNKAMIFQDCAFLPFKPPGVSKEKLKKLFDEIIHHINSGSI